MRRQRNARQKRAIREQAERDRRDDMDKASKSVIIKASNTKEEKTMMEMQSLGRYMVRIVYKIRIIS